MPIGKMDILITIQQATTSQEITTGGFTKTWSDLHTVWAEKIYKTSGEGEKSQQISSINEVQFRIRYQDDITQKMRIYDPELEVYYDIIGITMEGRRRFLILTAKSHNVEAMS